MSTRALQLGILGGTEETRCLAIDMIETVHPQGFCPERCAHCAAFNSQSNGGLQLFLSREELLENLLNPVDDVKRSDNELKRYAAQTAEFEARGEKERVLSAEIRTVRQAISQNVVFDYLDETPSTGIEAEPTRGGFKDFAEIVYALSGGEKSAVCMLHGFRQEISINPAYRDIVGKILSMCDLKVLLDEKGEISERSVISSGEIESLTSLLNNLVRDGVFDEQLKSDLLEASTFETERLGIRFRAVDAFLAHGYMTMKENKDNNEAERRFDEIVELTKQGIVRLVIVAVDFFRNQGRLSPEENLYSYVKLFNKLKPVLAKIAKMKVDGQSPNIRIVASLQGDDLALSPYSKQRAVRLFRHIKMRCNLTLSPDEWDSIIPEAERPVIKEGAAAENLPWIDEGSICDIFPYESANEARRLRNRRRGTVMRGRILDDGSVEAQMIQQGATYNRTASGPWDRVVDVEPIRRDTAFSAMAICDGRRQPTPHKYESDRDIDWATDLRYSHDIFTIDPFSRINPEDRDKFSGILLNAFGGRSILDIRLPDGKGGVRPISFADVKFLILKALIPRGTLTWFSGGNVFEQEHAAAMSQIQSANTLYREAIDAQRKIDKQPSLELQLEAHYAGEIEALTNLLAQLGFISVSTSDNAASEN